MSNRRKRDPEAVGRIEAEKEATRKEKSAHPDRPTKPPEGAAPPPPPPHRNPGMTLGSERLGGRPPIDPGKRGEALLAEIRDLLTEIRDALVPAPQEACEKCGSTHVQKEHHAHDHPCSSGACIRGAVLGAEHMLHVCGECAYSWVSPLHD